MKFTLPLSVILATLVLLSSCAAPSKDASNTTTAITTTAEPQNIYRPDLQWAVGMYLVEEIIRPVNHECTNNASHSTKPVPCKVMVTIVTETKTETQAEKVEKFSPTEYLSSIGWEVLPEDAWHYISGGKAGTVYYAAPNGSAFMSFNLEDMVEYYELDPSLINENRIIVVLTQSGLKAN